MHYEPRDDLERMMMRDPALKRHMDNIVGCEEYRSHQPYLFSRAYRERFYNSEPTPEESAAFEKWRKFEALFWEWEHEDALQSKVPEKPIPFPDRIRTG